ncbi:SIS domain-containing protein, partial [Mammaliicoccus vitulinus]
MNLVDENDIDQVITLLDKNQRIFVVGAGRSGFQAKGFAMRLMHIGYTSFVVGETITP